MKAGSYIVGSYLLTTNQMRTNVSVRNENICLQQTSRSYEAFQQNINAGYNFFRIATEITITKWLKYICNLKSLLSLSHFYLYFCFSNYTISFLISLYPALSFYICLFLHLSTSFNVSLTACHKLSFIALYRDTSFIALLLLQLFSLIFFQSNIFIERKDLNGGTETAPSF